jgi:hypothetical protein
MLEKPVCSHPVLVKPEQTNARAAMADLDIATHATPVATVTQKKN